MIINVSKKEYKNNLIEMIRKTDYLILNEINFLNINMNKLEYVNNNCKLESLEIDMIDTILQYMSDNNLTYSKLAKLLCYSFGYSEEDINKNIGKKLEGLKSKRKNTKSKKQNDKNWKVPHIYLSFVLEIIT